MGKILRAELNGGIEVSIVVLFLSFYVTISGLTNAYSVKDFCPCSVFGLSVIGCE